MKASASLILVVIMCTCRAQAPAFIDTIPKVDNYSTYDSTLQRKVYTFVEEMPEYPGGMNEILKFILKNFHPPEQDELQASVSICFIVEPDGTISNVDVPKKFYGNAYSPVDLEAIRVIKLMQKMKPGRQNGEAVPVEMKIPISCILWQD